ncbi:hypothetical protein VTO42DRAFT_2892 [Malbranchea cinnamomea]
MRVEGSLPRRCIDHAPLASSIHDAMDCGISGKDPEKVPSSMRCIHSMLSTLGHSSFLLFCLSVLIVISAYPSFSRTPYVHRVLPHISIPKRALFFFSSTCCLILQHNMHESDLIQRRFVLRGPKEAEVLVHGSGRQAGKDGPGRACRHHDPHKRLLPPTYICKLHIACTFHLTSLSLSLSLSPPPLSLPPPPLSLPLSPSLPPFNVIITYLLRELRMFAGVASLSPEGSTQTQPKGQKVIGTKIIHRGD